MRDAESAETCIDRRSEFGRTLETSSDPIVAMVLEQLATLEAFDEEWFLGTGLRGQSTHCQYPSRFLASLQPADYGKTNAGVRARRR